MPASWLRVLAWASTASARDLGFVWALIDDEEHIALVDAGALGEGDPLHETADARAHLDGVDGFEVTGELVPVGDDALNGRGDGDLWGLHRGSVLAAGGYSDDEDCSGRPTTGVRSEGHGSGARESGTHVARLHGSGQRRQKAVALR